MATPTGVATRLVSNKLLSNLPAVFRDDGIHHSALLQALVVVTLMSFLVFAGVFLIGDPVEIYVNDDADQEEREMIMGDGPDKPFIVQ